VALGKPVRVAIYPEHETVANPKLSSLSINLYVTTITAPDLFPLVAIDAIKKIEEWNSFLAGV
jgi:hypothetical protein